MDKLTYELANANPILKSEEILYGCRKVLIAKMGSATYYAQGLLYISYRIVSDGGKFWNKGCWGSRSLWDGSSTVL